MTTASPELEALLADLRSEGTLESRGSFTLDIGAARKKLKQFQLADPYQYVMPLVSAAVLGGARTLRTYVARGVFVMEFDGTPFGFEDLEGMFSSLLISGSQVGRLRLSELALGINAALALSPRRLILESREPGGTIRATFTARKQQVERLGPHPDASQPWTKILVEHGSGWTRVRGLVRRTLRQEEPELRVIAERCRLAPLELQLNGQLVPRALGWDGHPPLVVSRLSAGEPRSGTEITLDRLSAPVTRQDFTTGPYSSVLTLGGGAPDELLFVHQGLLYRRRDLNLGVPGSRAVVYTPELKLDLSRQGLVADENFELMLEALRLEVFRMLMALERGLLELPPAQRLEAAACLDHLVGFLLREDRGGDGSAALKLAVKLLRCREDLNAEPLRVHLSTYVVALLEHARGERKSAQVRARQALEGAARALGVQVDRNVIGAREDSLVSQFRFNGPRRRVEVAYRWLLASEETLLGPQDDRVVERLRMMVEYLKWHRPAEAQSYQDRINRMLGDPLQRVAESQARYVGKNPEKVSLR